MSKFALKIRNRNMKALSFIMVLLLLACQSPVADSSRKASDPVAKKIEKYIGSASDSTVLRRRITQLQRSKARVENNKLNGSVFQVKNYIKSEIFNPDSYQGIEWGKVYFSDSCYYVKHRYCIKDFSGAKITYNRLFRIDLMGNVTGYEDCK